MISLKSVIYFFICIAFLTIGCSKSDDQRRFENRALSEPHGITEMNVHAQRTENGEYDPDDWQISPVYSGQLEIDAPAFPNPVHLNQNLQIHISILYPPDNLSSIEVYAFKYPDQQPYFLHTIENQEFTGGLVAISLNPQNIASSTSSGSTSSNIYRILLYDDGQRNLITYGDVQIE